MSKTSFKTFCIELAVEYVKNGVLNQRSMTDEERRKEADETM